jgi:hypothetical protein
MDVERLEVTLIPPRRKRHKLGQAYLPIVCSATPRKSCASLRRSLWMYQLTPQDCKSKHTKSQHCNVNDRDDGAVGMPTYERATRAGAMPHSATFESRQAAGAVVAMQMQGMHSIQRLRISHQPSGIHASHHQQMSQSSLVIRARALMIKQ